MGRGMEAVLALAASTGTTETPWRVSRLAVAMRRERTQLSRTLAQSAAGGLLENTRQCYRTSVNTYAIAQALTEQRLRIDGLTVLEQLSHQVGESCFLGELYGDSTVTIAEYIGKDSELFASWVGRAYPAFNSDAGQATLWDADDDEVRGVLARAKFGTGGPRAAKTVDEFIARLREARTRGYSVVDEEAEEGLFSIAAPVFDFRSENVAALQIVGERERLIHRVPQLGQACMKAADELTALIGGSRERISPDSELLRN